MTTASSPVTGTAHRSYDVVILSGSAGAFEAVTAILARLPTTFALPMVIVLHHAAGRSEMLLKLLSRSTRFPVRLAEDGVRLSPRTVYLAPSTRHLLLTPDHTFASTDGRRINSLRSSVEPLLASVTACFGSRAIAVVLSGTGRNGAKGLRALHDAGGTVLAQDRASSQMFAMPAAAIEAGAVDEVLPAWRIARRLMELTAVSPTS